MEIAKLKIAIDDPYGFHTFYLLLSSILADVFTSNLHSTTLCALAFLSLHTARAKFLSVIIGLPCNASPFESGVWT